MSEWNKKRKVMHAYDSTAHIYDMRYAEEQTRKFEAALESTSLNKTDVVLDVGCGIAGGEIKKYPKAEKLISLNI